MINTILGQKLEMSQVFKDGVRYPVTWVKVGPCVVTQVKTQNHDGYWALQLGFGERRIKNTSVPMQAHLRGVIKNKKAPRFLREVRVSGDPQLKIGDVVFIKDVISVGDEVVVTGVSKGKGFAGVVKRHHFSGGPKTHGQSDRWRAPGSIGQGTTPGRVYKGKKMAGRMGGEKKTVKGLKILEIQEEANKVAILGMLPGRSGSLVTITREVNK
ncbi:50S ribosomal protein L3 [Candidatus Woesebacteria bacterium RIFCSPLOWO2_01_FULL_39_21]|uniref:Large ribosomal subunit protein uL3 n=1 Tax=Candidatus Woesebacteria bacterium RIFCSPLOWO2_01_FULL_39_21 TaxID=1802519 RepID=A0A1F8BFD4_9BACT|nr:MAG: 50S ribosomal protein L3 [Candidatus Woesebacteria bacterium RIFCSPHIGHO2_01_FULL_39_23]OGM62018.1 MAG: 50S ribosomal protein L3 [Candidatus Woesebacteria bacterium RIFCSPLOWO2_01_FULL_39_21]